MRYRDETGVRMTQPGDQLSQFGHRVSETTQLRHHEPADLTVAYSLERISKAGPGGCLSTRRLALVYDLDELEAASLTFLRDQFGLAREFASGCPGDARVAGIAQDGNPA